MPRKFQKPSAKFLWLIVAAIFVAVPLWAPDPYFLRIFALASIFSVFALSWNLLAGYAGQISFGHAFFFGGAAYASAMLNLHSGIPPPLSIFLSAIICGVAGLILGYPCLRVKGPYFVLMTWCFPLILISAVIMYFGEIFGGDMGLSGFQGISSSSTINYYGSLLILALAVFISTVVVNSRLGLILRAVRDNEIVAESVGINISKYKILIFGLSGFIAGVAGAYLAHFNKTISPELLVVEMSLLVIIMTTVGGIGSIAGPIVGGFLVTFLDNYLGYIADVRLIIYGLAIVAIVFARPQGLLPWSPKIKLRGLGK